LGNYPLSSAAGTFNAANGAVSNNNVSNASFNVVAKPTHSIAQLVRSQRPTLRLIHPKA
jgi:hypothetical protein